MEAIVQNSGVLEVGGSEDVPGSRAGTDEEAKGWTRRRWARVCCRCFIWLLLVLMATVVLFEEVRMCRVETIPTYLVPFVVGFVVLACTMSLSDADLVARILGSVSVLSGCHCTGLFLTSLVVGVYLLAAANSCGKRIGISMLIALVLCLAFFYIRMARIVGSFPFSCPAAWCGNEVRYLDVADAFDTGDIALACEGGSAATRIIFFTGCRFCHVGLIVRDPPERVLNAYDISPARKDPFNIYLFEANAQPVALVPMCEVVTLRYTCLASRKLTAHHKNLTAFFDWLGSDCVVRAPYNWRHLVCAFVRCRVVQDSSEMFCSELVMLGLQKLDVAKHSVVAENFSPHHFTLPPSTLPFNPGVHLDDPVRVQDVEEDFDPERLDELREQFLAPSGVEWQAPHERWNTYMRLLSDEGWNGFLKEQFCMHEFERVVTGFTGRPVGS